MQVPFCNGVSSFSISVLPSLLSLLAYPQNRDSASWDFVTFTSICVCRESWARNCKEEGWDKVLALTVFLIGFQEQTSIWLMLPEQTPIFPSVGRWEKHSFWSQTDLISNPSFPHLPVQPSASYWTSRIHFPHLLND